MSRPDASSPDSDEDLDALSMNVQPIRASSASQTPRQTLELEREEGDEASQALLQNDSSDNRPRRPRSNTFSRFSFEYTRNLLPLPLSSEEVTGKNAKDLNVTAGMALIIGVTVGSGIFASPGVIVADLNAVGPSLLVWVGSGLLAWSGASSFAELGSAIPLSGGAQAYLQYSFGDAVAYMYSFTAIAAVKPGSAAIIAIVCGEYMSRIFYHTAFTSSSEESVQAIPLAVIKLVAIIIVSIISILNAFSNSLGRKTQVITTAAKLVALVAVAIVGIVQLARGKSSDSLKGNTFVGASTSPGHYALALYSGLWAFDGWDQVNFVTSELKEPTKDLPKVIHSSLAIVFIAFMIANISYFLVLPKELVAHSNTVALDFGKAVLGPVGGLLFAAVVSLSCFGALNGGLYTTARLICVAGQEGFLPSVFAKRHSIRKTPINAILLNGALTLGMILFGDFQSLVVFFSICSWTFYFATVLSLLVLRIRQPDLPRPYKTFLATPVIFSCTALFLLFMPIFSAPWTALASFAFIIGGLPVYYLTQKSGGLYDRIPESLKMESIRSRFGNGNAENRPSTSEYSSRRLSRISEES